MRSIVKPSLEAAAAAVLLAPALFLASFALAVQLVTGGYLFSALARLIPVLPENPPWAGIILPTVALGCIALPVIVCLLVSRLYPALLLLIGGAAEIYAIVHTDTGGWSLWVPALGGGGLLLAAAQVRKTRAAPRRKAFIDPGTPVQSRHGWSETAAEAKARLLGAVMLVAAAAVAWHGGLRPLQMAQAGASAVDLSMKAFIAAPLAALGGIALLLGGAPVLRSFSGPPKGRTQVIATTLMVAIALVVGGAAYWWVGDHLRALGYGAA